MARVLLVRPPVASHELFAPGTEDSSTLCPPLGLAYIAACLRERGHECAIIDGLVEPVSLEAVAHRAARFDVVGVSVLSVYALRAIELIRVLKEHDPGCCIAVGGPHVSALPESLLERGADYAVVGEGEVTMCELVESVCGDGQSIDNIPGLVFRRGDQYVRTGKRPLIDPLDQIPMPARDLLPMARYCDSIVRSRGRASHALMTSRGCPQTCTFCNKRTFGTKVRHFSVERVVEEFLVLRDRYKARHVAVYDDNFLTDYDFACEVCEELRRRHFDASWSVVARADAVNEKVLRVLKRAGCTMIEYGIESGCQRILDHINKQITKDDIRGTALLTRRAGLGSRGFFMLGFPTETAEEMEETIRFAIELDMDLVSFTLLTPLPGTIEYRRALESGSFRDPEYYHHEIVPDFAFPENPLYVPEGMTAEELLAIHRGAYKRYYFRPRMIARRLLSLRSVKELRAMAKGAVSLLAGGVR